RWRVRGVVRGAVVGRRGGPTVVVGDGGLALGSVVVEVVVVAGVDCGWVGEALWVAFMLVFVAVGGLRG
ncbi:hypothetical protein PUR59_00755, partial [Streptomyces sp. SP18ES09]|uniref:hypothetical protein n=1 Tax=Streptomyces sp. SP18ES09 TaxID=3002532 RepID=UPI002E7975AC